MTPRPQKSTTLTSAEEFSLLVDAVQDYAIFLLGPDGEIRTWNRGASRIMGYDEEEVVGRHFSIFYGPEDLTNRKPWWELEEAERAGRVEDEGWRIRKDGTRFWADTIITVLRHDDGRVRGFAKITRDISARREQEEKLRESTEIFQLLVSSVRDYAIFMLDPDGHIATWNNGAQKIKGYAPEEIIGRHFSVFYPEEDVRDGKPERELVIARERGSVEDEGWRIRKDGTRFWALVVITAVHDSRGELRGFAKVTRDMTDRKNAEEMQRAYRVAQEANRAKDDFLMTLSHELRTPMTAILGWARLLPSMSPDDPMFKDAIDSMMRGAQLQARLIDDILDVSRIVSGKMRLSPETVEIAHVIQNAADAVTSTAAAKEITITISLSPGLGSITADATRIQQVIWNLLSNAVKFTPQGGSVQVSARRTATHIEIEVKDNGEGIDSRFLPHIFEPFRQAESPKTRVHGGLGLGLSIVRYIAEAHGGSVTAESQGRGKGATFTVSLPVRAASVATTPVRNALGDTFLHRDRLRGLRILLVDDDGDARLLISTVLQAAGATVLQFDSAVDALEGVERERPEVVITDIAMPKIDGYIFARKMREQEHGSEPKLVALSAFPRRAEEPAGFDAWLSKPIDPFHLVDEIAKVALPPSA